MAGLSGEGNYSLLPDKGEADFRAHPFPQNSVLSVFSVVKLISLFHNSVSFPTTQANEKATRQQGGLFFKGE